MGLYWACVAPGLSRWDVILFEGKRGLTLGTFKEDMRGIYSYSGPAHGLYADVMRHYSERDYRRHLTANAVRKSLAWVAATAVMTALVLLTLRAVDIEDAHAPTAASQRVAAAR